MRLQQSLAKALIIETMRFFWIILLITLLPMRSWTGGPLASSMHAQALQVQSAQGKPAPRQAHEAVQAVQTIQTGKAHAGHDGQQHHEAPHDHAGHHAQEAQDAQEAHKAHPADAPDVVLSASEDCPDQVCADHHQVAGHGDNCASGHACQTCADCSACHTPALAQSVAGFKHVQGSPALPQAAKVWFASADAAPGHKPPIS